MPVGEFKNADITSVSNIPEKYANFYTGVGINYDGTIEVSNNYREFEQLVQVGPLLVENGRIPYDYSENVIGDDGNRLFASRKPKNAAEKTQKYFKDGYANVDQISPGELSHATNKNPRSAIAIRRDGSLLFIYVEGRNARGDGVTLNDLAELCAQHGAHVAVNMDGGRSSRFLWKKPHENIIYNCNETRNDAYPVGTILSLTGRMGL